MKVTSIYVVYTIRRKVMKQLPLARLTIPERSLRNPSGNNDLNSKCNALKKMAREEEKVFKGFERETSEAIAVLRSHVS
jgi:hypothetical protein